MSRDQEKQYAAAQCEAKDARIHYGGGAYAGSAESRPGGQPLRMPGESQTAYDLRVRKMQLEVRIQDAQQHIVAINELLKILGD